ncbi:MAG: hypothetical protein WAM11_12060 [Cyanobium sp.]
MELRARLVHAESGRRVVEVRAREGDRLLGSALGEAADAEVAEDRARQRLLARLRPAASPLVATSGAIPQAQGDHGPSPGPAGRRGMASHSGAGPTTVTPPGEQPAAAAASRSRTGGSTDAPARAHSARPGGFASPAQPEAIQRSFGASPGTGAGPTADRGQSVAVRQPAAADPPVHREQTAGSQRTAAREATASMVQSPGPDPTAALAPQSPAEPMAVPDTQAALDQPVVLDRQAVPAHPDGCDSDTEADDHARNESSPSLETAHAGGIARYRRVGEPAPEAAPAWEPPPDPEDWSSDLAALDLQLRRLGWDRDREATYLQRAFGHPSRNRLTNYSDLRAYLQTLERLPEGSEPAMAAVPLRRSELLRQCDTLLAQLGWNADQGRSFLERELQAASRQQLNDQQLLHFNMLLESEMLAAASGQAAVVP